MSRILVIDDDPIIRQMCKAYFTAKGHTVTVAKDGKEGITRFDTGSFDLVITDLLMPEVNGYEVIEHVKSSPKADDTAVILLTADKDEPEMKTFPRIHAQDDLLTKPFDMPVLERKVAELLAEYEDKRDI